MAIEDTKKVMKATQLAQANKALEAGWTLLAVIGMRDGNDHWTEWHLGWQKADPAIDPLDGFTLGKHVTG